MVQQSLIHPVSREVSCFSMSDVFVDVKQSCDTIHTILRIHDLIRLTMFFQNVETKYIPAMTCTF